MAESYINKGNICITLSDREGYVIRHKSYLGAYFCITFDGNLVVATGQRFYINHKDWQDIQNAIQEGYAYMTKLILVKAKKFHHKDKVIDFKSGSFYLNTRNNLVFVHKVASNCYLEIIIGDRAGLINATISNGCLFINVNPSLTCVKSAKLRKTKPKLLDFICHVGTDFYRFVIMYNGDIYWQRTLEELANVL